MKVHNFVMMQDFYREDNLEASQWTPVEKVTHYIKQRLLSRELRPGDRFRGVSVQNASEQFLHG